MTILQTVGGIVAIGAAVLVAVALLFWAAALIQHAIAKIEHRGEEREREYLKNKLRATAWWFSEDPPTMELLMNLCERSEWDARAHWRNARKTET